jgi:hypothetical protein
MYLEDGPEESSSSSSWQPSFSESPSSGSCSSNASPLSPSSAGGTPLTEEEMVRRILTGYDSAQASQLSTAEGTCEQHARDCQNEYS